MTEITLIIKLEVSPAIEKLINVLATAQNHCTEDLYDDEDEDSDAD